MAEEILFLDGTFSGTGWTGTGTDIDEGITAADGAEISSDADGEADIVTLGFADTALSDSDTITQVDIVIRGRVTTDGGDEEFNVSFLIGGAAQGATLASGIITSTHANYTLNDIGWNSDWTAAQLNGMQIEVAGLQAGMPTANTWHIDTAQAVITYTPGSSPQTIGTGQVTETSTARAVVVAGLLAIAVGQVTEANIAQAVAVVSTSPFFEIALSSNIAPGGENTTDRLTGGGTHGGGRIQDDKNPADTIDLAADESGEWAWNIKATGATEDDTQYSFRLVLADGTLLDTYTVEPKWTVSSGQTITAGQVSEINTAQAVTLSQGTSIAVGQVAETNTSQSVTFSTTISISAEQITEVNTAQSVTAIWDQSITATQVVETDTSQSVTANQATIISVNQVAEANTSQPVTIVPGETSIVVAQVIEVNTSQAVTVITQNTIIAAQVIEINTAQAVFAQRYSPFFEVALSANIATGGENTTNRLTGGGAHGGGRIQDDENPADTVDLGANESGEWAWNISATGAVNDTQYSFRLVLADDTLLDTYTVEPKWTISSGQTIGVGQVTESDIAQSVTLVAATSINVGQPVETNTAQVVTPSQATNISVGQILESDIAQSVTVTTQTNVAVGQVSESNTAQAAASLQGIGVAVSQITETNISQAITVVSPVTIAVGQVIETDTTQSIILIQGGTVSVGQASETNTAQSITAALSNIIAVGQVTETNITQPVNSIPSTGQFHKIFTLDYGSLPTNSFAYGVPELSGILAGDGYQMDLVTSPDSHSLSGDSEGVITVGGTLTQIQTANYTIYDASDDTIGSAGVLTIIPPTQTISVGQVGEINTAQAVTVVPGPATIIVGQVTESDITQPTTIATAISLVVSQVTETDTAQPAILFTGQIITAAQVVETSTVQVITLSTQTNVTVAQVTEANTSQPVVVFTGQAITAEQVIELNIAQTVTLSTQANVVVLQVVEITIAQAVTTYQSTIIAGQATEINVAQSVIVSTPVIVTESGPPITITFIDLDANVQYSLTQDADVQYSSTQAEILSGWF